MTLQSNGDGPEQLQLFHVCLGFGVSELGVLSLGCRAFRLWRSGLAVIAR